MDPYVEGWLWPDFHHRLASAVGEQVVERLSDRYVVQIETRSVALDLTADDLAIFFPDVKVLARPVEVRSGGASPAAVLMPPRTVSVPPPPSLRVPTVEVYEVDGRRLVTSIEILSPANKNGLSRVMSMRKWHRLHAADVHLVDIDLLRGGRRPILYPPFDGAHYLVTVARTGNDAVGGWPLSLRDRLPTIPIPLLEPDEDVPLDLQSAVEHVYRVGRYHLTLDYSQPLPPPPLSPEDTAWVRALLDAHLAAATR